MVPKGLLGAKWPGPFPQTASTASHNAACQLGTGVPSDVLAMFGKQEMAGAS